MACVHNMCNIQEFYRPDVSISKYLVFVLLTPVLRGDSCLKVLELARFACAEAVGMAAHMFRRMLSRAEVVDMAAHTNYRMLPYAAVLGSVLAGVVLDCCILVATIGNLPVVRSSGQPVARSHCHRYGFGCSRMNFRLPVWARRGLGLEVVTMAAGNCCSPVVGYHIPASGAHTAVVYQGPVMGPVLVHDGLSNEGVL